MSPICVGASYRTADLSLLERLAVPASGIEPVLDQLLSRPSIAEAVVLSTCNRVEVYADVATFHGGVADIVETLRAHLGGDVADLAPHLYVHYRGAAVRHAFRVASGLDSMVVGEAQILGQVREAYGVSAARGAAGRLLHELMQRALRVGKRTQSEAGIDRAGRSVMSAALEWITMKSGRLVDRSALVVGAGAMGSLALAALRRAGAGPLYVANRGFERAARIAAAHAASAVPFADLASPLATVDLVFVATAAPRPLLTAGDLDQARTSRRHLIVCDLAVPRNVEPRAGALPWVTLIDVESLARAAPTRIDVKITKAETIVNEEVVAFLTWLKSQHVAPTVAALRARADDVVAEELCRLEQRRSDLTDDQRAEVANTVHRVVQRLLHQPSVRVRQLAAEPGGERYVQALRELFDLRVPCEVPEVQVSVPPTRRAADDEFAEELR